MTLSNSSINAGEFTNDDARVVAAGMRYPIRQMDADAFKKQALVAVQYVAKTYTGANDVATLGPVWNECLVLLRKEFQNLGIEEVRHAFRLAAAGKTDANLIAYGGVFTVQLFGAALRAYLEYRKRVHSDIVQGEHVKGEAAERDERNANAWKKNTSETVEYLTGLMTKNNDVDSWKKVKEAWFKILEVRGLIDVDEAYKKISWVESKHEAVAEFLADPDSGLISNNEARAIKRYMAQNPGDFPEKLTEKAKAIYRKKLVFLSLAIYEQP